MQVEEEELVETLLQLVLVQVEPVEVVLVFLVL